MKISMVPEINMEHTNRLKKNLETGIPHILDGIGLMATASVIKNFESEGRPEKWTPLSPETLKKKTGNMILHEGGVLKGSIIHEAEPGEHAVYVGPGGPATDYARIHDRGGMAGRNKKVRIPQRRYLLLQPEDREDIEDFIKEQLFK